MRIIDDFELKIYMNLAVRQDRRASCQLEFMRAGLDVRRFPAVSADRVSNHRGMGTAGRYACGLTQRMIIRRAKMLGARSLLLFEDDAVLHSNFQEMCEAIDLPRDWGIFYFGCQHIGVPERVSRGVVRVKGALDMHAVAIRAEYYDIVLKALRPPGKGNEDPFPPSDVALMHLHETVPTYAAYPNLAWQRCNHSNLANREYSSYHGDGSQAFRRESINKFEEFERSKVRSIYNIDGLKLHLGCGNVRLPGWTNLEVQQVDITRNLDFRDESIQYIFLEHVIEHITARQAFNFFSECRRVLLPGGVLRLAFPSAVRVWKSAELEDYSLFIGSMGWGDGTKRDAIKAIIFENGHKMLWTSDLICVVLEAVGFICRRVEVGESEVSELVGIEQHWREVGHRINEVETEVVEAVNSVG